MGPAATVDFLAKMQAATPAKADGDHIRVVMDLNPRVPDRNTAAGAAGRELGAMAARLRDMGAEVLAMPCNTAHAHKAAIDASGLELIDMIAETARAATAGGARAIGVLATPGGEALYRPALEALGARVVQLEGDDRPALMALIYGVKAGDVGAEARAGMRGLAGSLVGAGAEAVVAGCTEVPLLLSPDDVKAPLVDSAEVLARACVAACMESGKPA